MITQPRAAILNSAGINCHNETFEAFRIAKANPEHVHMSQLLSGEVSLTDYPLLAIPGGFSDSDAIQAGRTLGIKMKTRLADQINAFKEAGGLGIGICNGNQVLTELGILPGGVVIPEQPKQLSLVPNERRKFIDRWQTMQVLWSQCLFVDPIKFGEVIELPIANGEGQYQADATTFADMQMSGQLVFAYSTKDGEPTDSYPDNPSGSYLGIAGTCDFEGQFLGLMPHPERFVRTEQHPNWHRGEGQVPYGRVIIEQMVKYAAREA